MKEIIFSGLVSLAVAILAFVLQNLMKENKKLKKDKASNEIALKNGVLSLLRSKLMEAHSKYMERNSIATYEYENWTFMYRAYKDLGGNGMITHMNEDIEELKMNK